nr:uncharacterized protein LOC109179324 [Ipomoea batatas]
MGESSHTILELTARLLVYTEQQGLFHMKYPIVSDDSWLYFVNQTSRLGELHVYVTATTDTSFMGLFTGLTQFSEGGSGSSSYNICSLSEPFVDFSHYAQTEQIWEVGAAVTRSDYQKAMNAIEDQWPQAYQYLSEIPKQSWALSYDGGYRFGIMTTNSSESFNNTLKGCRMLLVTAIARLTFNKLVAMLFNRRTAGELMLQAGLRWPNNISKEMSAREQFKHTATVKPYNHQIGLYEFVPVIEDLCGNTHPPQKQQETVVSEGSSPHSRSSPTLLTAIVTVNLLSPLLKD